MAGPKEPWAATLPHSPTGLFSSSSVLAPAPHPHPPGLFRNHALKGSRVWAPEPLDSPHNERGGGWGPSGASAEALRDTREAGEHPGLQSQAEVSAGDERRSLSMSSGGGAGRPQP